jgi:hypothetical protein
MTARKPRKVRVFQSRFADGWWRRRKAPRGFSASAIAEVKRLSFGIEPNPAAGS